MTINKVEWKSNSITLPLEIPEVYGNPIAIKLKTNSNNSSHGGVNIALAA